MNNKYLNLYMSLLPADCSQVSLDNLHSKFELQVGEPDATKVWLTQNGYIYTFAGLGQITSIALSPSGKLLISNGGFTKAQKLKDSPITANSRALLAIIVSIVAAIISIAAILVSIFHVKG